MYHGSCSPVCCDSQHSETSAEALREAAWSQCSGIVTSAKLPGSQNLSKKCLYLIFFLSFTFTVINILVWGSETKPTVKQILWKLLLKMCFYEQNLRLKSPISLRIRMFSGIQCEVLEKSSLDSCWENWKPKSVGSFLDFMLSPVLGDLSECCMGTHAVQTWSMKFIATYSTVDFWLLF